MISNITVNPSNQKMCDDCDLGIVENIKHIIFQCCYITRVNAMLEELREIGEGFVLLCFRNCPDTLSLIRGCYVDMSDE